MFQTLFNGIITGVIMTLPALAVTLLFGVLKFPNFAVGAMMTVAAYLAFALNAQLGLPLLVASAVAALAMGCACIAIDQVTFKPLRERGAITLMVASLGLGFILENIARFAYGNTARSFALELARPFRFLDLRMNHEQMITLSVATTAMLTMWFLLAKTPAGRAMRAVADNPALALAQRPESELVDAYAGEPHGERGRDGGGEQRPAELRVERERHVGGNRHHRADREIRELEHAEEQRHRQRRQRHDDAGDDAVEEGLDDHAGAAARASPR